MPQELKNASVLRAPIGMNVKLASQILSVVWSEPGRIKALVLRRDSDWYGVCFGDASAAFRRAAAAAAIEEEGGPQ